MRQAQYPEPLERVAARGVAAGRRFLSVWQAHCPEPLERVAARGVAAGRRFLSVWQAQYPEPLEGVAARGVAAGRRPACRRSYIGVCRGGGCVTDLCRRSYIEEVSV